MKKVRVRKRRIPFGFWFCVLITGFIWMQPVYAEEDAKYWNLINGVTERIFALKKAYPHFAKINAKGNLIKSENAYRFMFTYENGIEEKPKFRLPWQRSENVKAYADEDGISLRIYFYKGPWLGPADVVPITVGDLNIVAFINGNETDEMHKIKQEIGQIIQEETKLFEGLSLKTDKKG